LPGNVESGRSVGRSVVAATEAHAEQSSRIDAVCDTDCSDSRGRGGETRVERRTLATNVERWNRRIDGGKGGEKIIKDEAIRTNGQWWDGRGSRKSNQPNFCTLPYVQTYFALAEIRAQSWGKTSTPRRLNSRCLFPLLICR
jgi:hypothetical protein